MVPLTNDLKGKVKNKMIEWSGEFQELKDKLTLFPVLYVLDYSKEYIVMTDASLYGAGIMLCPVRFEENFVFMEDIFQGSAQLQHYNLYVCKIKVMHNFKILSLITIQN